MTNTNGHAWQKAQLRPRDGTLVFDQENGIERALKDGFFYVQQPPDMEMTAGDHFARSFYLPTTPGGDDDPYHGFALWTAEQLGPHQGYFRRQADQTEQFFLESTWWDTVYPKELAQQAANMRDFALAILRGVLNYLDLPPSSGTRQPAAPSPDKVRTP